MPDQPLRIIGAPGSPYSRKLRAVLRYRRIPHVWMLRGSRESRGLPEPRVDLLPQLIVPGADGALKNRVDSTPLIRDLETRIADLERSGAIDEAAEQRDALRLGRLLLAGHEVAL